MANAGASWERKVWSAEEVSADQPAPVLANGQRARWCPSCSGGTGAWLSPQAFPYNSRDLARGLVQDLRCARCRREEHAESRAAERRRTQSHRAARGAHNTPVSVFDEVVQHVEALSGLKYAEWTRENGFWHEVVTFKLIEAARAAGRWKASFDERLASGAPRPDDDARPAMMLDDLED